MFSEAGSVQQRGHWTLSQRVRQAGPISAAPRNSPGALGESVDFCKPRFPHMEGGDDSHTDVKMNKIAPEREAFQSLQLTQW